MGTVTRNFRLEEELIGDLVFLAEKEKRSLNNFVATQLQLVVDNAKGEKETFPRPNVANVMGLGAGVSPQAAIRPLTPSAPAVDEYDALVADIMATTYSDDLKAVMKEVEKSGLGAIKKAKLRAIADNHRLNFTN